MDNMLSKGLPPNLSADDPSLSFTFKGFDVNIAATPTTSVRCPGDPSGVT